MADSFSQILRASFDGIEFPVRKVTVRGGIRQHDHEFPKAAGAATEKLGRKLYVINMSAVFYDNLLPPWDNSLWPANLFLLRDIFERQKTAKLAIPTIGEIDAVCVNWTQEMDVKARSGETVEFEFKEDQSLDYLIEGLISIRSQSILVKVYKIQQEAALLKLPNIFDKLVDKLVGAIQFLEGAEAIAGVAQARLGQVLTMFARLDSAVGALSSAANYTLLEAFLDTWAQTQQLHDDLLKQSLPLIYYTVPRVMSVSDVARAIYGSTEKAADILTMNPIEDAFAIRPGTQLRAYAPS